jgi:hypothetical protein
MLLLVSVFGMQTAEPVSRDERKRNKTEPPSPEYPGSSIAKVLAQLVSKSDRFPLTAAAQMFAEE